MRDLTIELEDRPGTLAVVDEALGRAGINIDGACGVAAEGKAVVHLMVGNAEAAKAALAEAGIAVTADREVIVFSTQDRPGELGERARRLADAGVNIEVFYLTTRGDIVVGVDDLDAAVAAFSSPS